MKERKKIKKVLVAPLDWGLGHTTRCIPIIKALQQNGCAVVVAGNAVQRQLLQQELTNVDYWHLDGYHIRYSKYWWWLPFELAKQIPKIVRTIVREHGWLQKQVATHKIDLVISDNRFGLFSKKTHCVFITHQLTIKTPIATVEKWLRRINFWFIEQYDACWIPDSEQKPSLAGVLSHPPLLPRIPVVYLGLLSRFPVPPLPLPILYDYCFALSGPEPQRTLLENTILEQVANIPGRILLVRGLPNQPTTATVENNVTQVPHLSGQALLLAFAQSRLVICRSGYTTVMELVTLQKKALLIPTPGQTEQAYLAQYLHELGWFLSVQQHQLNLSVHLPEALASVHTTTSLPVFNQTVLLTCFNSLYQAS